MNSGHTKFTTKFENMRNQVLIGLGFIVGILCFLGACRQRNKAYGLEEKGKSMMRIDRRAFIHPSVNGNILMAGNTGTIYGTGTHYIFEINPEGEVQWASSIPSPYGYLMDITTKTDKSGYILTGYQRKSLSTQERSKGYLMSIDLQGQTAPF